MNVLLAAGVAGGTAAIMSERTRKVFRRGIVYGLAGAISAGDVVASAAKEVAHSAEEVVSSAGDLASDLVGEAQNARHGTETDGPAPAARKRRAPAAKRRSTAARRRTPRTAPAASPTTPAAPPTASPETP
jgi:hypothetical protein